MKIFIKYVLKSMTEKKGRFMLILLSVSISTALVFASTGLIDMVISSLVEPQLKTYEDRDIVITPSDNTESFFQAEDFDTKGLKEGSILKEISMQGMIVEEATDPYVDDTKIYVYINGRYNSDMSGEIVEGSIDGMEGMKCAISERVSSERKLGIGDYLEITIAGQSKKLEVKAIYKTDGVFYNDSETQFNIYIPYEYLSQELGAEGRYNVIFAESSMEDTEASIDAFNQANDEYEAALLFNEEDVYGQVSYIQFILYIMLAIVVIMSAIIIYSTFKLIITERMQTIGTFLSQGSTVGKVKTILYLEGVAYGIFGAIIGSGLGVAILNLINKAISPLSQYGIYEAVDINPACYIGAAAFALILPTVSSYFPVRKLSKLQVKDIILNDTRIVKKMKYKKMIIGLALIAVSVLMYVLAGEKLSYGVLLVMIASLTGVIMAYPKFINILSKALFRLLRGRSKTLLFAINNLRTSKVLLGNITLIIISLFSVIAIQSAGTSLVDVVTKAYSAMDCDIIIGGISTIREGEDDKVMDDLVQYLGDYGIKDDDIIYAGDGWGSISTEENQKGSSISLQMVEIDSFMNFLKYFDWEDEPYQKAVKAFKENDNSVILTTAVCKSMDIELNDFITIDFNGCKKEVQVSGIIDGILYNNGYFAMIDLEDANEMFGYELNSLYLKTDKDINQVITDIKPKLKEIGASFITIDQMRDNNLENNRYMIQVLNVFSYLAIIIAALGIINNISIGFLQRKGEFAVLSSAGMENKSRNLILLFESFMAVTWAMIIMTLYSGFGISLISMLIKVSGMAFDIKVDYMAFPTIYLMTLGIVLIATIPVLFKSKKLSIIEELKYE